MIIIKEFIFGVRVQGVKLSEPSPIKERNFDPQDYQQWCNEFHVSMLHGRTIPHF
jgi:hypothetical protein